MAEFVQKKPHSWDDALPGADQDIIRPLERKLKKQFEAIMLSSKVLNIEAKKNGSLEVTIEGKSGKSKETYDKVLIAVGRKPNIELLKLDNTNHLVILNTWMIIKS